MCTFLFEFGAIQFPTVNVAEFSTVVAAVSSRCVWRLRPQNFIVRKGDYFGRARSCFFICECKFASLVLASQFPGSIFDFRFFIAFFFVTRIQGSAIDVRGQVSVLSSSAT